MLLGGQQLHRGGVMNAVRRHIHGRIELAPGNGIVEGAEGIVNAVGFGKGLGAGQINVGSAGNFNARVLAQQNHMLGCHATGAENENAQFGHQRKPASPSSCRRGPFTSSGTGALSWGTFGASSMPVQALAGL